MKFIDILKKNIEENKAVMKCPKCKQKTRYKISFQIGKIS